jgi:hypothetical protein
VSFPEKFWPLWPPLQWPSLKEKCLPPPPNPYAFLFLPGIFGPFTKRGQSFGGMLGHSSNFFASSVHLNINSNENSEKPSQDHKYGYLFSCPSLPVFSAWFWILSGTEKGYSSSVLMYIYRGCWNWLVCRCAEKNVMVYRVIRKVTLLGGENSQFQHNRPSNM